jgi:hypothetical protein
MNEAACISHCCPVHGCKYGHDDCPVRTGAAEPEYPDNNACEYCDAARPQWTGVLVPGSNIDDILAIFREGIISQIDGRKIRQASMLILTDDKGFAEQGMLPTTPQGFKDHADMLASAAERWYKRWDEAKESVGDVDDYGKGDEYVS